MQNNPAGVPREDGWYKKKPVAVRAVRFDPCGAHRINLPDGVEGVPGIGADNWAYEDCMFFIKTLENNRHTILPGEWVITGVRGEHYAIKHDIFLETYEPAPSPDERTPVCSTCGSIDNPLCSNSFHLRTPDTAPAPVGVDGNLLTAEYDRPPQPEAAKQPAPPVSAQELREIADFFDENIAPDERMMLLRLADWLPAPPDLERRHE